MESPPTARPEPRIAERPIAIGNLDPDAVKVVRRLRRFGHQAYLVGGCVRDLLLGYRPKDFDVATSARPPELRELFRNCRIIGRRFRLAHMMFREGKIIEVATFRRDPPKTDDDDPLIRQDNWFGEPHEDALRRDFTINALFYDVFARRIIDYVGGLDDLERRLIRTIGDPDLRLREDPVRLLRAIKFSARADLGIDQALYRAMLRQRHGLERATPARLFEELLRLLRGGAAHRSFWLAREIGALDELMPDLSRYLSKCPRRASLTWSRLQALDGMLAQGRLPSDAVLLTALLEPMLTERARGRTDQGRALREALHPVAERLVMPRRQREAIRQTILAQRKLEDGAPRNRQARIRPDVIVNALDFHEVVLRERGAPIGDVVQRRERVLRVGHRHQSVVRRRPRRRSLRR